MNILTRPLFPLGQTVATPGALMAARKAGDNLEKYLKLHLSGDWGVMSEEDKMQNEIAIRKRDRRIFSAYHLKDGTKIWIITEYDFSVTTILLPEEY